MSRYVLKAKELIHNVVDSNCHIETDIRNAAPHHSHDFYEVFIILDGECVHKINEGTQNLKKGNAVFIRPFDAHSYEYAKDYSGPPCCFLNVNFVVETVNQAFSYIDNHEFVKGITTSPYPSVISLDDGAVDQLVKKASLINIYEPVNKEKARIAARGFLVDVLTYFYMDYTESKDGKAPDWFNELLIDIQQKSNFTAGTARIAKLSGKSQGYLNRMFKKYMGTTPTEYINRLKLNYAKQLIITTDMPIIDIAMEAGFDNLSHFYHLFKDSYGAAPAQMRKERE